MFTLRHEAQPGGPVCDWLVENKEAVLEGAAPYRDVTVTGSTEFHQYTLVISFLVGTMSFTTAPELPLPENRNLVGTRIGFTIATAFFGWWGLPFGPFLTIHALVRNIQGGKRCTAARLLDILEWGSDAPIGESGEHQRAIVTLTDRAVSELRARIEREGFPSGIAVRIVPKKAGSHIEALFDYPISDGRDWIDKTGPLVILIDKQDSLLIEGQEVDFAEDRFFLR